MREEKTNCGQQRIKGPPLLPLNVAPHVSPQLVGDGIRRHCDCPLKVTSPFKD